MQGHLVLPEEPRDDCRLRSGPQGRRQPPSSPAQTLMQARNRPLTPERQACRTPTQAAHRGRLWQMSHMRQLRESCCAARSARIRAPSAKGRGRGRGRRSAAEAAPDQAAAAAEAAPDQAAAAAESRARSGTPCRS